MGFWKYRYYRLRNLLDDVMAIPRRIGYVIQRIRYGISRRDVWEFDSYLAEVTARGLRILTSGHGTPHRYYPQPALDAEGNPDYNYTPEIDDAARAAYLNDLNTNAALLEAYVKDLWHPGEDYNPADEVQIRDNAKLALHWVADHLGELWD